VHDEPVAGRSYGLGSARRDHLFFVEDVEELRVGEIAGLGDLHDLDDLDLADSFVELDDLLDGIDGVLVGRSFGFWEQLQSSDRSIEEEQHELGRGVVEAEDQRRHHHDGDEHD
jgi:hypothetical protein